MDGSSLAVRRLDRDLEVVRKPRLLSTSSTSSTAAAQHASPALPAKLVQARPKKLEFAVIRIGTPPRGRLDHLLDLVGAAEVARVDPHRRDSRVDRAQREVVISKWMPAITGSV